MQAEPSNYYIKVEALSMYKAILTFDILQKP